MNQSGHSPRPPLYHLSSTSLRHQEREREPEKEDDDRINEEKDLRRGG